MNTNIQFLRAIAIIAVVLIHTCPLGEWQVMARPLVNFAVALFLFLSGYLTQNPEDNYGEFCRKRIFRVLIPYVIWSVLYTLPNDNWYAYVFNLLTTKACYTLYYIAVYIQFVLLTPLFFKLSKSKYSWLGLFITPIYYLIFKYPVWFGDVEFEKVSKLMLGMSCFGWFTYYYMGIWVKGKEQLICSKVKLIVSALFLSLMLQVGEGYILLSKGIENCGTQAKLSTYISNMAVMLIVVFFLKRKKDMHKNSVFTLVGDYSFGIYLLHPLLLRIASRVAFYHSLPFVVNTIVILLINVFIINLFVKLFGKQTAKWVGFV